MEGLATMEALPQFSHQPSEQELQTPQYADLASETSGASNVVFFPNQRVKLRPAGHLPPKLSGYANTVATILYLPTHPNTWYQVELHDGVIAMLRSSSFSTESPQPQSHSPTSPEPDSAMASTTDSPSLTGSGGAGGSGSGTKRKPKRQVNYVGRWVRITAGRFEGCTGWVTHGRSGYYGVKVSDGPECMKREKDLDLIDGPPSRTKPPMVKTSRPEEEQLVTPQPPRKRPRATTSSKIDWIAGQTVRITQGKNIGETGTVVSSGHGFIAVNIRGEQVMKRANELQLEDDFRRKVKTAATPVDKELCAAAGALIMLLHHSKGKVEAEEEDAELSEGEDYGTIRGGDHLDVGGTSPMSYAQSAPSIEEEEEPQEEESSPPIFASSSSAQPKPLSLEFSTPSSSAAPVAAIPITSLESHVPVMQATAMDILSANSMSRSQAMHPHPVQFSQLSPPSNQQQHQQQQQQQQQQQHQQQQYQSQQLQAQQSQQMVKMQPQSQTHPQHATAVAHAPYATVAQVPFVATPTYLHPQQMMPQYFSYGSFRHM